jgi:hypothetical protein
LRNKLTFQGLQVIRFVKAECYIDFGRVNHDSDVRLGNANVQRRNDIDGPLLDFEPVVGSNRLAGVEHEHDVGLAALEVYNQKFLKLKRKTRSAEWPTYMGQEDHSSAFHS